METINEIFGLTLLSFLNPVTWLVVIALAIWAKRYWLPGISGVLTQTTCVILFLIYPFVLEGDEGFSELLSEFGLEDIAFLFAICIVSGITISALVILLVRQRRIRQSDSANA